MIVDYSDSDHEPAVIKRGILVNLAPTADISDLEKIKHDKL